MLHLALVLLAQVELHPLAGMTVQDAANAGGCSTTAVKGLSQQIVDETNCLIPNAYSAVPSTSNLVESASTFSFMQTPARDALVKTLGDNPGMTMNVDSMLRTVAAQYLLYAWYQAGMCGIQLAATPGTSNHEQGLAFDTNDYSAWTSALQSNGFQWYGSADVVHFDYVGAGTVDLNGKDVLAFQKLWNENNPTDLITEDGQYGTASGTRLQKSPADGFPLGASCSATTGDGGAPPGDAGAAGHDSGSAFDAGSLADGSPVNSDGSADTDASGPAQDSAASLPPDAAEGNGATPSNLGVPTGCACRAAPSTTAAGGWGTLALGLLVLARRLRARVRGSCRRAPLRSAIWPSSPSSP